MAPFLCWKRYNTTHGLVVTVQCTHDAKVCVHVKFSLNAENYLLLLAQKRFSQLMTFFINISWKIQKVKFVIILVNQFDNLKQRSLQPKFKSYKNQRRPLSLQWTATFIGTPCTYFTWKNFQIFFILIELLSNCQKDSFGPLADKSIKRLKS